VAYIGAKCPDPVSGLARGMAKGRCVRFVATCMSAMTLQLAAVSQAAEYRMPTQFNGHRWGEPFTQLPGIKLWHANTVQSVVIKPTGDATTTCFQFSLSGACNPWYSHVQTTLDRPNTYALAEYYLNVDANPWASSGARLYTVSYLYCAVAIGQYEISAPVKKSLHLCGSRVIFLSDKPDELARHSSGYQSNLDRILHRLIADYGEPWRYEVHGKITIQTANGDEVVSTPTPEKPAYIVYRWCPVGSDKLHPDCKATLTLEFEATHGEGTVLFATPELYDFANARHSIGDQKNDMYTLLYNHLGQFQPRQKEPCTGKRVCNPTEGQMTAADMRGFEP
jgi:hypothetical protein